MALIKSITRLFALAIIAYGLHSTATFAEELDADSIRAVLSGNSVTWNHQGLTQQQYFSDSGFTVYQDASGNMEAGVWSVTDDGLFCSNWQQRGWLCYELSMENTNQLLWNGPVNTGFSDTKQTVNVSRLQRGNKTGYFFAPEEEEDAVFNHASQLLLIEEENDVQEISLSAVDVVDANDQYQNGYYYQ